MCDLVSGADTVDSDEVCAVVFREIGVCDKCEQRAEVRREARARAKVFTMTRILSFTSLFVAMVFVVVHATDDDTCTMDKDLLKLLEDKKLKGAVSALKAYGVHHLETLEILAERETDCNWKWWGGCSHGVDTMVQKHGLKIMLGELLKNKLPSLVADLQDIKKRKEEAEQKRLREEAEQKRLREEAEQKRLREEAEQKRLRMEAEQKPKEELVAARKSPYELAKVILKMLSK